jgi:UDP-N-acetylmuramoyl-L-alanyl-D-glutamate--2,6-diaminopimelate ligase
MITIKSDSRKVNPGDTFVCIRGEKQDGHEYAEAALDQGAALVVVDHDLGLGRKQLIVPDTYNWMVEELIKTYGEKINKLRLIGITGTNGKTTTAFLTYQMLNELGSKTAYIGTIGFYLPGEDVVTLINTTPDICELYDLLDKACDSGCENAVLEVSSHALDQRRVDGLTFTSGAFMNLTQDHLDYHKYMENYLSAKLKLCEMVTGSFIINDDDDFADVFRKKVKNPVLLGVKSKDIKIKSYEDNENGTLVTFSYFDKPYVVETNLKNGFNVYNYLTAVGLACSLGYDVTQIIDVTPNVYPPKGRCEMVKVNGGFAVVDYAHTPDAVRKIITSFRETSRGRIVVIIGAGGDRDALKRPIMGDLATELADYVIFTSDNPRTEEPMSIIEQIVEGAKKDNYEVEVDRRKAIHKGLDMMKQNDILLILGKGHENYQIIGTTKHHFDDIEEVNNYIKEKANN